MKNNYLILVIIALILGCSSNKTKNITVVNTQSNCNLAFELKNALIYLPKESVIQYSDSISNEAVFAQYKYFSSYFTTQNRPLTSLDNDTTEKELYSYLKEKHNDSLTFETYKDFGNLYFSYCRLIVSVYLSTGNVKLFNKLTNKYEQQYQIIRKKDEHGGETDYYYFPDKTLFYEDVISIGL